jgi:hypothetical protein
MKVFVVGPPRFADVKQVQRALDAFHRKHHVDTLIVDEMGGVAEQAYFWATSRRVERVLTRPARIEALTQRISRIRHHAEILVDDAPDAVIAFAPQHETPPIKRFCDQLGIRMWWVPADYR